MIYNKMVVALLAAGCSAVFVCNDADFAYCLSAAHCVKGETDVATFQGKQFGVRWIFVDKRHDLAVGKAFAANLPPLEPTIADGQRGPVDVVGFPNRQLAVRRADLEPDGLPADGADKQALILAPPLVGGTSGGGVFQDGSLVGIATHSDCRGGRCTTSEDLKAAAVSGGLDLNPTSLSQRDLLMSLIGAAIWHWWSSRKGKPSTP